MRRLAPRPPRLLLALLLGASAALLTPPARADLPPPEGTKFVSYRFVVHGSAAFPDHVVLVFPWSLSDGAPTTEYKLVPDGEPVRVGRRVMATPHLHAMRKADHDEWRAGIERYPTPEALEQLFAGPKVIDCGVDLNPRFSLESSDPSDEIVDHFRVTALSDTACALESIEAPATPTDAPVRAPEPREPAEVATPPETESSCRVASPVPAAPLALLAFGALLLARRRRA